MYGDVVRDGLSSCFSIREKTYRVEAIRQALFPGPFLGQGAVQKPCTHAARCAPVQTWSSRVQNDIMLWRTHHTDGGKARAFTRWYFVLPQALGSQRKMCGIAILNPEGADALHARMEAMAADGRAAWSAARGEVQGEAPGGLPAGLAAQVRVTAAVPAFCLHERFQPGSTCLTVQWQAGQHLERA